ncbi:MAG: helix-turn-helix domain-containing protein [Alphaproteobacteria bacterium]|nr:helix-turn-helix domain-containing protein [Alphaproteobacteria bacterium]
MLPTDALADESATDMNPTTFTTRPLSSQDQFEAWREWYKPVFDVVAEPSSNGEFTAETHLWMLDGLAMSRTIASSAHVVRSRRHLRHEPLDHWVISYCARGAHFARTADVDVEVPSGVPYLWSLGQEFLHERTHGDRVQFLLARDAFRDLAPVLDAALGTTLDTPLGRLLGDYMIALERRLTAVTEEDFPRLSSAVGTIVAAAVAPSEERMAVAKTQIDLGRKERVRRAVRRHLRTPTLGPRTLGRLIGMSRSNLYRLFEDIGGVARYIQRERLLEAHAVLSDPGSTQSISAIAEDLCFSDPSAFSRTFKREFGYSPTEVRSAALAGVAARATVPSRAVSDRADFAELLRGF